MSKIKKLRSGGEFMSMLQNKKEKRKAGLGIFDKADENVICVMEKKKTRKQKFIGNDVNSKDTHLAVNPKDYVYFPHIPIGLERYIVFISGEGGLGKSGMTSFMMQQTAKHITKKIYYICGTSIDADPNISSLKYVENIPGEFLSEIDVERDLSDSLIVMDDIDNWEYHKDAIKLLNKAYEVGRKFHINIIYISHNTTKATESKIYSEVNLYITNTAKDNRMFEKYLKTSNQDINDMEEMLKTDVFVAYNKNFHCVYTDKKIWKLE